MRHLFRLIRFALEKTVRVGALPKGTQEALLQQAFEKATSGVVSRVSVHEKTLEALVELASEEVRLRSIMSRAKRYLTANPLSSTTPTAGCRPGAPQPQPVRL